MKDRQIVVFQKSKAQKKRSVTMNGPSVGALTYSGPTRVPQSLAGSELDVYQINFAATLTTSAAGLLNTVFNPGTQITSSADWTNIQNLWEEYRILSWAIDMVPWTPYTRPTTDVLAPVYSVIDRQTATALASIADAVGFGSCELHTPSEHIHRVAKMTGQDEAEWVSTGTVPATNALFYLKLYSSGNSNSINLYDYKMVYLIQVKGRK